MRAPFGLAAVATLITGSVADAQTFTVTNTNDTGTGSLRDAVASANTYGMAHSGVTSAITFQSGLSGTIDLGSQLPEIDSPVEITGPGARELTIDGGGGSPIFYFGNTGEPDTVSGLALADGERSGNGGAVFTKSPLTLDAVAISGSSAAYGGAVDAQSALTLEDATIAGNSATGAGGGLDVSGALRSYDSTIAGNTAAKVGGGAVVRNGSAEIVGSTITDNTVPSSGIHGGGLYFYSDTTPVAINDSIVSGNTAPYGPDLDVPAAVASKTAAFSLIGNGANSGITPDSTDIVGRDPQLGPLQNNGGPTDTMLPADTSPVIDAGHAVSALTTDQRGLTRPVDLGYPNAPGDDGTDIGAVELQPSEVLPTITSVSPASGTAGTTAAITGTHLAAVTEVMFGSTPAPFTANSDSQLTATVPAGTGTVEVTVSSPGGNSSARFTYAKAPKPKRTTRTFTTRFGDQRLSLTVPLSTACVSRSSKFTLTIDSTPIPGSKARKLKFTHASFFMDAGMIRVKKVRRRRRNGRTKVVRVKYARPNVVVHHVPSTVSLGLTRLKRGTHTVQIVFVFTHVIRGAGHRRHRVTVTRTSAADVKVCLRAGAR